MRGREGEREEKERGGWGAENGYVMCNPSTCNASGPCDCRSLPEFLKKSAIHSGHTDIYICICIYIYICIYVYMQKDSYTLGAHSQSNSELCA